MKKNLGRSASRFNAFAKQTLFDVSIIGRLQRADSTFSGGQSAPDSTKDRAFCERNHPLVISSVYILRALKEFVSSIHKPKKGLVLVRVKTEATTK